MWFSRLWIRQELSSSVSLAGVCIHIFGFANRVAAAMRCLLTRVDTLHKR